ncbi:MAG: amylo-alpha-1,6-glucosidase [Microbacterium sp.]|nr:amylo-alpha-1,6-glucosidase [Microbacterium sp.]
MTHGRQPFLHDAAIALSAPTQAWSRASGDMTEAIDGVYHGDRRFIRSLALRCGGEVPEAISVSAEDASTVVFDAVTRGIDDPSPDPHVRLTRVRTVQAGRLSETVTVASVTENAIEAPLTLRLAPDFRPLQDVKAGSADAHEWTAEPTDAGARVRADAASFSVSSPDGVWRIDGDGLEVSWTVRVEPGGTTSVAWSAELDDPGLVVRPAAPASWFVPTDGLDPRLARWVPAALADLAALRLALPDHPDDAFLAAGAPWFLTLFGRDSLWAARMLLSVDVGLAASTLRVLARLQGTTDDPDTEEEPGKIPHELRAGELRMPGEGIVLPPLYYGTVDATALGVCLLVDAAAHGMPETEVRELLPALGAAMGWIRRAASADGFLSYVDSTGRGLANQGWKDSGDSIQWRDGTLAAGPIALCEVQGCAYEAAMGAAGLLDRLGVDGSEDLRAWAGALRERFAARFWVETPEGRYPAIALDRDGAPVDTLTSNIGHLLGTGILDPDDEAAIARLLTGPSMSSGFGVRTMTTEAAGYWPLGYHRGAVWAHDSAIVAHGMARAGLREAALDVVGGLLAAAEAFDFRMPELHSGDARRTVGSARSEDPRDGRVRPAPYPAACRPQAWSAAAAITCLEIVRG